MILRMTPQSYRHFRRRATDESLTTRRPPRPRLRADPRAGRALPEATRLTNDGVEARLDKEKPCGERSRTILPGRDWELEIRKAVCERV